MGFTLIDDEAFRTTMVRAPSPAVMGARNLLKASLDAGTPAAYDTPTTNYESDTNRLRSEAVKMGINVAIRKLRDGRVAVKATAKPPAPPAKVVDVTKATPAPPKKASGKAAT